MGNVVHIKMAVQMKRRNEKSKVSAPVIQNLRGSLDPHEQALFAMTSDFTKKTKEEAPAGEFLS